MSKERFQAQLDRCCGPAPKPRVRQVLTGIEKELKLQPREEVKA